MKFFIDTANLNEIRQAAEMGLVDGVTTNPTLLAKEGKGFRQTILEICSMVNGPVSAELTKIHELRLGNVVARDLDAVIAPGLGPTNVIGMNFLSRLASVRLEGDMMILVPHNPQPPLPPR